MMKSTAEDRLHHMKTDFITGFLKLYIDL